MALHITDRRKRKVLLFPDNALSQHKIEKELNNTLDRVIAKFSPVPGWMLSGGDAVRIHTGGKYHRILEEIELAVWDYALPALIERAEQNPRRYSLISRTWMGNASPQYQFEKYQRVQVEDILKEIEYIKKMGVPRDKHGSMERIQYRNLRIVEDDALEGLCTHLNRDNSIDLTLIYEGVKEPGQTNPFVVCPDAKMIIPSTDVYSISFQHNAPEIVPGVKFAFDLISTEFLMAKCRTSTAKNKQVLTYDLGILEKYCQKIK